MKVYEQYYDDVMTGFVKLNQVITVNETLITENATYYELRQFVALLLKTVNKKDTKDMLNDILLSLGKLEIMNKPAPTIKKLKKVSPSIF